MLFILIFYLNILWCPHLSRSVALIPDMSEVYHNSISPAANLSVTDEKNFAEGGSHNRNVLQVKTLKDVEVLTSQENQVNPLVEGAPSSGTSGVKPRKGAPAKPPIVARKGAPCDEDVPTNGRTLGPPCLTPRFKETNVESLPPPVYEPISDTPPPFDPTKTDLPSRKLPFSLNDDHKNHTGTEATTFVSAKKPKVTISPADSDELLKELKNDRNVVIPVVALVCAPILVLLMLFVYKRIQDARGDSHYTRMGFLIEDIYND